jgi:hypothetical protein
MTINDENNKPKGGDCTDSDNAGHPLRNQIENDKAEDEAKNESAGSDQSAYSDEEEELIKKRLEDLGYL